MYDLTVSVYGFRVVVPVLVVPGQADEMILSSNAIKWLISQMKKSVGGQIASSPENNAQNDELPHLLSLLSQSGGSTVQVRIGTAKLKRSVTLQAMSEHLVWAKLPTLDVTAGGVRSSSNLPNARPDLQKFWWGELSLPYGGWLGSCQNIKSHRKATHS